MITSAGTATGTVGQAFSYQITATNSPTSFNATGLPTGLSVNAGTGLMSGTPTAARTSSVTLSAANAGGTGTATLTLTINNASTGNCHVVTPSGGGNRSGSDWNNAMAGLPSTLVRGDTYFMADGGYRAYSFNTADSGTTVITIKKATATDHCTDAGFQSSYASGQAVFTPPVIFSTDYWVMDGQYRSTAKSGHGFKVDNTLHPSVPALDVRATHDITLRYVEIRGT